MTLSSICHRWNSGFGTQCSWRRKPTRRKVCVHYNLHNLQGHTCCQDLHLWGNRAAQCTDLLALGNANTPASRYPADFPHRTNHAISAVPASTLSIHSESIITATASMPIHQNSQPSPPIEQLQTTLLKRFGSSRPIASKCAQLPMQCLTHSNYKGSDPFGNLTLNTKTCVSRLKPDSSLYGSCPKLTNPDISSQQGSCFPLTTLPTILSNKVVVRERNQVVVLSIVLLLLHIVVIGLQKRKALPLLVE